MRSLALRRWWVRPLATVWALWFALITVGPGGFGACPEHGTGGHEHTAVRVAHAPAADPHAAHHAQQAHHAHHVQHGGATESATPGREAPAPAPHQCTCLGACCMVAPSTLPPAVELVTASIVSRPETPTPAYRAVVAARRVFSQPYAIGPPAAPIA